MDKIEKALRMINAKEKEIIKDILDKLREDNILGFGVQKLRGHKDIFRAKKGNIRIIYRKIEARKIFVLAIERRSEKTYRNF